MTILRTNTIAGIGTNGPVFDGDLEFNSQNYVILPKGTTDNRIGLTITSGALRYNTDSSKVELYDGSQWTEVQSSRPDLNGGARGVFGGGAGGSNVIDYINISSTGNALDFGDLTSPSRGFNASCASNVRGIWAGGYVPSPAASSNVIDSVTISSTGNAADFGDLTVGRYYLAGCSSATRGLFGGSGPSTGTNTIDYITMSATGNAVDFGDLTLARGQLFSCSSPTRGVWAGGNTPTAQNIIDFVTISTLGNAQDFGDLTVARATNAGCSNSTRGLFGFTSSNIDYITLSTLGNAVTFGSGTLGRTVPAACASSTRGVWGGGYATPAYNNTIEYVTIAVQGNAVDFGDLTAARGQFAACSNAHGGL